MSGIQAFNSAVQQFFNTTKNLQAIDEARSEANRRKEGYDIDKKMADLKLRQARTENLMTENDYKIRKMQMDEYFKQQKKLHEAEAIQIDMAESSETEKAKQAATLVQNYAPSVLEPVNVGGHIGFRRGKQEKESRADIFKLANDLAKDDDDEMLTYEEKIDKYLPKAREYILGESAPSAPEETGRVRVKAPNGKTGYIPASKLKDALKNGFSKL